jgi:hypothetical protein
MQKLSRSARAVALVISIVVLSAVAGFAAEVQVPAFNQWTHQVGTWEATDWGLMQTVATGSNTNAYVALPQQGQKHIYEWTIMFGGPEGTGILNGGIHVLCTDATATHREAGYFIWQDGTKIDLYRINGNSLKLLQAFKEGFALDATKVPMQHTYRFVVDTVAKQLTLYRDNVLVAELEDDVYTSGKYISVRTNRSIAIFSEIKYSVE